MYENIRRLRAGKTVNLEGIIIRAVDEEIKAGDLYVAERNTGLKLLTAKRVDKKLNCIYSTCNYYPFNICECVKIEEVKE